MKLLSSLVVLVLVIVALGEALPLEPVPQEASVVRISRAAPDAKIAEEKDLEGAESAYVGYPYYYGYYPYHHPVYLKYPYIVYGR